MKLMQVDVKIGRAESEPADVLVLMHCEGQALAKQDGAAMDKILGGLLREVLQSKEFEGKANETLLYHTHAKIPAKRLLLVGLGKKHDLTLDSVRQAMGHAAKRVRQSKAGSFTVIFPNVMPKGQSAIETAQA
ncbi:MAG TPA: M17 family peptidase N-terminal domain-containing protein, partial [Nitrospira sp.]